MSKREDYTNDFDYLVDLKKSDVTTPTLEEALELCKLIDYAGDKDLYNGRTSEWANKLYQYINLIKTKIAEQENTIESLELRDVSQSELIETQQQRIKELEERAIKWEQLEKILKRYFRLNTLMREASLDMNEVLFDKLDKEQVELLEKIYSELNWSDD